MKNLVPILVLLFGFCTLIGCSSGESASGDATPPNTSAAMAKCASCGKDFPETSLKDHDGKKMCETCIASHNH